MKNFSLWRTQQYIRWCNIRNIDLPVSTLWSL